MIVSDKEATIQKAHEIANKMLSLNNEEIKSFKCEDDPAENLYLTCHAVGALLAKVCISLNRYGHTYSIEGITVAHVNEWINIIAQENIELNMRQPDES